MRKLCMTIAAAVVLSLAGAPARAQENPIESLQALYEKAMEHLQAKEFDNALDCYAQALESIDAMTDVPAEVRAEYRQLAHYNSACALSLQGKKDAALEHFAKALETGFDDFDHIGSDTDLDNIRHMAKFKELVASAKKGAMGAEEKRAQEEKTRILGEISKEKLFDFAFDLPTVQGGRVSLAELKGNVVLVDVWGTWCPPCRKEVPHLVELYKKHKDKGFRIVGLNNERVTGDKAIELIKDFCAKNGIEYPCAVAPKELIETIPDFEGYPTLLLIDREGRVRLKKVGYTEASVLEAIVGALLEEGQPKQEKKKEEPAPEQGTF